MQQVYAVAWLDALSGFDTHEALDRVYLTREEADAEVARVAAAVEEHRKTGSIGCFDNGLTVIELPLGGHVRVDPFLYLAKYVNMGEQ